LGLLRLHPDEQQRSIYNAFLHKFIGNAFAHIEALTGLPQHSVMDRLESRERSDHGDGQAGPVHANSGHSISKS